MGTAELALERIKTDYSQLCDNGASMWCKSQPFADLILIHEPGAGCKDAAMQQATWKGLESAVAQNLTRSIGVSNFVVKDLEAILATAKIPPAANQCSMHIGRHDDATISFCKAHKIQYQAYSPLGGPDLGGKSVMTYPAVKSIAKAHNVSSAQIALRWVLQQDVAVVTATGNKQYMAEDLAVTGFALTEDEMKTLSAISGQPPTGFHR
jgi:diketogulonate reductase-like aldo/keto reductase